MTKEYKIRALLMIILVAMIFNSCDNKDEESSKIRLDSYGPSPLMRGEQLRFIGTNLDKVTSVVLPNNLTITTFATKTPTLLVIEVPKETVNGSVTLNTPQGDIVPQTLLVIAEPITISSFEPAQARPGTKIKIKGTYLNLVSTVIFSINKEVTTFESQSETEIELVIPNDAQTGKVTLSDGQAIPNLIESENEFVVVEPSVTGLSPSTVKAGSTLVINGADLDLVEDVTFSGDARVLKADFISKSGTTIEVKVPNNAKEGKITLRPASLVEVLSPVSVSLVGPTVAAINPNPAKNKSSITVTGSNLDLVNKVIFGGGKEGSIQSGGTATSIVVDVPKDAVDGKVKFSTLSDKWDSTKTISLVVPTITSFTPLSVSTLNKESITITGTNLDIVDSVIFAGGWKTKVANATATSIEVKVVPGSLSGKISIVTSNGAKVTSGQSLTIIPNVPNVAWPTAILPGKMVTLTGTNMNVLGDIIFPGEIKATTFGAKTATSLEVFVPAAVARKPGKIKFISIDNEILISPDIEFLASVDPVLDASLVFFDFDGKNSWWNDKGAIETNSSLSVDGTSYFRVNSSCSGWTGFFWRNGGNDFPGTAIGTNVDDYVFKFEINVIDPITGGELAWRLKGTEGDFFLRWKPWVGTGSYKTAGWITVTLPISDFVEGAKHITDMSAINSDFGLAFDNGSSTVNIYIDNVRFEHK